MTVPWYKMNATKIYYKKKLENKLFSFECTLLCGNMNVSYLVTCSRCNENTMPLAFLTDCKAIWSSSLVQTNAIDTSRHENALLAIVAALEDVSLHLEIAIFGSQMDLDGQHHLDVSLLLRQMAWWHDGGGFCSHGPEKKIVWCGLTRPWKMAGISGIKAGHLVFFCVLILMSTESSSHKTRTVLLKWSSWPFVAV